MSLKFGFKLLKNTRVIRKVYILNEQPSYISKIKLAFLRNHWAKFHQILYKEMTIYEHDIANMTEAEGPPLRTHAYLVNCNFYDCKKDNI